MQERRIGGLLVTLDEEEMSFALAGNHAHGVSLDSRFRQELIEFLQSFKAEQRNQRSGFRIPLSTELLYSLETRPAAILRLADQSTLLLPLRDISLTGISFSLENQPIPTLDFGASATISLQLGREQIRLDSKVRRIDSTLLALSYESEIEGTHFEPPEALLRIVRTLETAWLRMRRKEA